MKFRRLSWFKTCKICLEIYELGTAACTASPGLAMLAAFKKVKLDLLTNVDVTNDRKMYQRQNMSCYWSICWS